MELNEKSSNDLEQYIALDGITTCLENFKIEIDKQNKKIKLLNILIIILTIVVIVFSVLFYI